MQKGSFLQKNKIIDFVKGLGKTIVIGIVLMLSAMFVLFILNYWLPSGGLDPSIFLISAMTGWCTICFKLWFDFMRGKTIVKKIISAVIYLGCLTWIGISIISFIYPEPILNIYLVKALFSWYFGSIIGILYEIVKS